MNLFQDYFSDYVSDFQLSTLGAGVIRRFAVKRAERELTVVLALNELVDYSVFKSTMRKRQVLTHVILGIAAFLLMVIATVFSTVKLVESMSSK